MPIKYQIFISSTYEDLKEEREQVIKSVLEMGHIPVGMEMFSAGDEEQWAIISRQIEDVDYYAVIIGHRYGSETKEGLSYTEKEYDYAIEKGVPVLGFIIDENAPWPKNKIEKNSLKVKKLDRFKEKTKKKLVQFWKTKEDLHGKFSIALMKAITGNPRTGWVKASEIAGPEVMKELTRLSSENAELRKKVEKFEEKKASEIDDFQEVAEILLKNEVLIYVRETAEWGEPKNTTLFEIFDAMAPRLIVENTPEEMAKDIALAHVGTNYYSYWPIPENYLKNWLADFSSLDLIEPSKKKHSVNDKSEYWSLTKLGKKLLKSARRFMLEKGLKKSEEEQPEEPIKENEKN